MCLFHRQQKTLQYCMDYIPTAVQCSPCLVSVPTYLSCDSYSKHCSIVVLDANLRVTSQHFVLINARISL